MAAGKEIEVSGGGAASHSRPFPPPPPPPSLPPPPLVRAPPGAASSPVPPPHPSLPAASSTSVALVNGQRSSSDGVSGRSGERSVRAAPAVADDKKGDSPPVNYLAEVQEIKKQQPGELRKLLRLLKRKKARQQRHRKNQQATTEEERKTLLQRVPLKSKTSSSLRGQQKQKQPSVTDKDSETESEADSGDEDTTSQGNSSHVKESVENGDASKATVVAGGKEEEDGERRGRRRRRGQAKKEEENGGSNGERGVSTATGESDSEEEEETDMNRSGVTVEYVAADELAGPHAEIAQQFAEVFEKFRIDEEEEAGEGAAVGQEEEEEEEEEEEAAAAASWKKKKSGGSAAAAEDLTLANEEEDEDEEEEEDHEKEKRKEDAATSISGRKKTLSKKQRKLMMRPSVAELKQKTNRPDMVEVWDTTSADPEFLVYLKGLRNTVGVPVHWSQKRRYLQWKRGFEKAPFKLPPHIEATKISEVRSALVDAESQKSLRQRMREKVRPKQNKLAIDYQVLHDCFFKHAVRPALTNFGDLYYEGKEFEKKQKFFTPGKLSDRLKIALSMGPSAPPPWLINMQRYGAPPAYPRLRIPGVNAPIPAGCSYGYHAGGWGKPPVDDFGNPLFSSEGTAAAAGEGGGAATTAADEEEQLQQEEEQQQEAAAAAPTWGELPEGPLDEEEEEDETAPEGSVVGGGSETPFLEGAASVGGATSLASGLESPASSWLELRKSRGGTSSIASSAATGKPYTILTPQEVSAAQQAGQLFGVKHTYRIPSAAAAGAATPGGAAAATLAGAAAAGGAAAAAGRAAGAAGAWDSALEGGSSSVGGAAAAVMTPVAAAAAAARGSGVLTPALGIGSGAATPFGGGVRTPGSGGTVAGGTASSFLLTGTASVGTAAAAAAAGLSSSSSGTVSSFALSAPPTPLGGAPGARGAQTPINRGAGFRTPVGGGITVTLNPNEMEQEGVFTADVIRQQLRQHEEAAARAKQAAGQIDYTEARKRKGDEIRGTQAVSKSKKKKQFKF